MKSKTTPFFVPTLSQASPDYAANLKRRDDMQATLSKAERESTELRARLDARRVTATESARAERVALLLGDGIASDGIVSGLDSARLSELDRTIADMKLALIELDKRVAAARAVASTAVCKQIDLEHRRRAGAICVKLIELHDTLIDYWLFADQMNSNDIIWQTLVHAHPCFLGRPSGIADNIANYLREAVRDGNFAAKNVPVELS